MKKGFRHIEMFVSSHDYIPNDFINLPVIKDGEAIGFVSDACLENWTGIKLTLTIWVDIELMIDSNGVKPSAIIF